MAGFLIDSNVLLDIVTQDPQWYAWSAGALAHAADQGALAINPLIYAEVSVGFGRIEDLDAVLPEAWIERRALPWSASFLAGKCFARYRKAGGQKRSPMPDFYIGAHAAVEGMALLTRDEGMYKKYFPNLSLVTPKTRMK
jgi:predicted nucleic acid-binding protein